MKKNEQLLVFLIEIAEWMRTRPNINELAKDKQMFALFKGIYEKVKRNDNEEISKPIRKYRTHNPQSTDIANYDSTGGFFTGF
tara:strand:- start:281 stop:529 length:249 start_codon:yes stop_codon:yes gene_type:complete